jgi:hypothetical protein
MLGDLDAARHHYELAAGQVDMVPAGSYADMLRDGIARARIRVSDA